MPISLKRDDGRIFKFWTTRTNPYKWVNWIEVYFKKKANAGLRLTFGPCGYFDNRAQVSISLYFFSIYLHLPIYSKREEDCDYPEYGFYTHANALWICRGGQRIKKIGFPWELDWVRTSALRKDGTWEHERKGDRKSFYEDKWKEILWSANFPYLYVLHSGIEQYRIAHVKVEQREWRQHWLKWTRFFATISTSISVDFNDEVGERTGSWKGGTIGCGYNMKKGETPEQTLRRMERERKFN